LETQIFNVDLEKNKKCTDQLFRLENEIKKAKLIYHTLGAVFIVFEKTFDMMWKDGFLSKIKKLSINGNIMAGLKIF